MAHLASRLSFNRVIQRYRRGKDLFKLGKIIRQGVEDPKLMEVKTMEMKLNEYLTKYCYQVENHWVVNRKSLKVKVGDLVCIQKMDKEYSDKVAHDIAFIVFVEGEITDPITGRRIRGRKYRDRDFNQRIGEVEMGLVEELTDKQLEMNAEEVRRAEMKDQSKIDFGFDNLDKESEK